MVTLVIFGASFMTIIFFLLGAICKILAAAFNGLLRSSGRIGGIVVIGGFTVIVLYMVCAISHGIIYDGFIETIGMIILMIFILGVIGSIIGGLGSAVLAILVFLADLVLNLTSMILEGAAAGCQIAYIFFLNIITRQIEKC